MTGVGTLLGLQWRVRRRAVLVWVVALTGGLVGTAAAVASLYDTPAKIHSYALAAGGGAALVALNGRVEGVDSLGGVIQNEFGFLAAFLLPLLGISLVAGPTRGDEAAGRLEQVLAGQVHRWAPALAALLLAVAAITVTGIGFGVGLVAVGVPVAAALCYAAALATLALVFSGIAALAAQVVPHSRDVYAAGLLMLVVAYVVRGVGDVTGSWVSWLSPLGWAERTAPFGATRWPVLLLPLLLSAGLGGATLALAARRDLGRSALRPAAGSDRASPGLRSPLGLALRLHRPALLGWLAGALLLAGLMGTLARQFLAATAGNPSMAAAAGLTAGSPEDGLLALTLLYLAVVGAGYVVQTTGSLLAEERTGRLETQLAGGLRRRDWLLAHTVAILGGLALITGASGLVLAGTTAWSLGRGPDLGPVLTAALSYLPAQLVLAGVALAVFGIAPRAFPTAWAVYAGTAFVALLGPGLRLPGWIRQLAPTSHVGHPPDGAVASASLPWLGGLGVTLLVLAFLAFRRREVPQA